MLATLATIPVILAEQQGGGVDPLVRVGIVMVALTLVLGTINMQRRRKTRTPDIGDAMRAQAARIRQQQGVHEDLEQIVVQISELARELNAQMDTRFAKLDQVITEADQKIATLEGLVRQAAGVKGLDVTVDDGTPIEAPSPAGEGRGATSSKPRKAGEKGVGEDKAGKEEATSAKAGESPAKSDEVSAKAPSPAADPSQVRYRHIYELADQGRTPVEIARQTGQTTGEIELILNLRKSHSR